jgi:hypothetical protein
VFVLSADDPRTPEALRAFADASEMDASDESVREAREVRKIAAELEGVRCCRVCGCTDALACWDDEHGACTWAEPGLCSACVPAGAAGGEVAP